MSSRKRKVSVEAKETSTSDGVSVRDHLLALGIARPSTNGVVMGSVDGEVMDALPEGFVFQYTALWLEGLGVAVGGRRGLPENVIAPNVVAKTRRSGPRTSTNQVETRGGARPSKSDTVGGVEFASERAVNYRRKIDAKLRTLARQIRSFRGDTVRAGARRCSLCKRFGEDEWVYCPWDGRRMEETV